MTTPSDEVELLPVATRKGFAEVARDLIQQAPIDASEPPTNRLDSNSQAQNISLGTSSGHNSSYPPRSSSREARKHTKKPSRQSSRKRELREPEKYNPTTGLRGQGTAAEVATTRDPEHAPQNDHQEPDKSLLQTEVSASTQSEFLAAATSPLNEKVPPGSYKRIIIGKGKPIPPGIKLPPHIERYLKMDQPESKKRDDAMTAGYVRQGTPIVTRTPEERDPRLNSVYAQ
ncbi:hypothetical protein MMC10_000765 [Thelotrema lepadinum]|nr:hypothetical protein [Thelotrema lepadinum]